MKTRVLLACIAVLILALPAVASASKSPAARKSTAVAIPCGTRAEVFRDVYNRAASERTYRVNFTAFGGGNVGFIVPPAMSSVVVPNDNTSRPYEITVTIPADAALALPRQVEGIGNPTHCTTGPLQIDNIVVSVVP